MLTYDFCKAANIATLCVQVRHEVADDHLKMHRNRIFIRPLQIQYYNIIPVLRMFLIKG